jgi:hypothetical protein
MAVADVCRILLKVSPKRCIHTAVVLVVSLVTMRQQAERRLQELNMTVVEFARRLGPLSDPVLTGLRDAAPSGEPPKKPE